MKIFLDTSNLAMINTWLQTGLIDGITTNPSTLSKEGGDPKKLVLAICAALGSRDVSIEVTKQSAQDVYKQALEIAALAPNVVVKVPCHPTYFPVIQRLVKEGVAVNVTLVFSLLQGMMMSKLGVRYISPFVGRLDDIDVDGSELLCEMRSMIDHYEFDTQILAASIRHVRHFHDAVSFGADVVTLPVEVLEKATQHPLTEQGIAKFNADWHKLGITQFP